MDPPFVTRREFLAGALATGLVSLRGKTRTNLVPDQPSTTPNYWCTWGAQNYAVDRATFQHLLSHSTLASNLTERAVFGANGWANAFPRVQRDLYIVFDVGWDVPAGTQFDDARWKLGSQEVASDKFPSCTGNPTERLRKLNQLSRRAGWKGAGLWIPAQAPGDGRDGHLLPDSELERLFRERLRWSHDAGIGFWKVDYGVRNNASFRRWLTGLAREVAPGLQVEHSRGSCPLNDVYCPWEKGLACDDRGAFAVWGQGSVLKDSAAISSFADVFRTYDVTAQLSTATTLDRVVAVLSEVASRPDAKGIVNCEDEPYLAAAFGLMMGVMRHPMALSETQAGVAYDPYETRRRVDEVTRAVRWQRLAPAFAMNSAHVLVSPDRLMDRWRFSAGETWADWVIGTTVGQSAPACAARGLPLPEVSGVDRPFVIASRNPNGAVSVASLPRVDATRGRYEPLSEVTLTVPADTRLVGVFGRYALLRLSGITNVKRVLAQDLAGDSAEDITTEVTLGRGPLQIPGKVLARCGLSAASPGDISSPGVVLQLES